MYSLPGSDVWEKPQGSEGMGLVGMGVGHT